MNKYSLIWVIAILGLGFALPTLYNEEFRSTLSLQNIPATKTANILAQVTFYALIVERMTEVYINTAFANNKASILRSYVHEEQNVKSFEKLFDSKAMVSLSSETIAKNAKNLAQAKTELNAKKASTRANERWVDLTDRIKAHASIFSVLTGIVFGLAGVHVLGSVGLASGNTAVPAEFGATQSKLLLGTDVLTTGLLLAGGAAGMHPIINKLKSLSG